MRQMVNRDAPVKAIWPAREVVCAFTRDPQGTIFYCSRRSHGNPLMRFRVLSDGSVEKSSDDFPLPIEDLAIVEASALGITKFRWAPLPAET